MSSIVAFRATTIDATPNNENSYNLAPGKLCNATFGKSFSM